MGERTRSFDWSATPVGPVGGWPQSLKTAVSICLASRYPIVIWWGNPAYTMFYNDAYRPFLGVTKHPGWLGRSGRECWREIWPTIGPMLESVFAGGEATWSEDLLLVMERNVPREETYFTFSYSPILDDLGKVGGIFCACTETTGRVLNERRLGTLRDLGRAASEAKTTSDACAAVARALAANRADVSFALTYLLDGDGRRATLTGLTGLGRDNPACPPTIDLTGANVPWHLRQVTDTGRLTLVDDLADRFGPLPGGAWPEPTERAAVLPIGKPGLSGLAGFVVAGLSPRLEFTDSYKGFLDLLAGQIAAAVANARAYEEERRRAEALAELDRAKTAFFANVSHEFRTPLTLLLGPAGEALAEAGDEAQRERLRVIQRNALRLQKLVNTLLDFSRIESGRIQASYEPTDLAALTAELASVFRSAVEKAGMRLVVDCPPLPGPVYVDREMWEKVVLNLMSNAFKFTLDGEIEVTLRDAGDGVRLAVRDTGTGIAEDQLAHIFERFHRIEGARARTHEGTGIGLALVQELVKLHAGRVEVASVPGRGTTFTVALRKGKAHLPADRIGTGRAAASTALTAIHYLDESLSWLPPGAGPAVGADGDRPRVVLADDNADMRDYVRRLLGDRYEVEAVTDGEAALAAVRRRLPDLVLTDVMMPRLDGFGLLRELRADPDTRDVPVIVLSARAGEESRVEGMEAGADDYLVKPFTAKELLAHVSAHLQMARLRREATERLRDADHRKDEFLATLAHELRNPLAPLRNGLHVMRLARDDRDAVEKSRAMMERQLNQMVRLVDDLMDVSRISRGKVVLRRERVEVAEIVRQAVETSRPLIEERGHELRVRCCEQPLFVDGDAARLAQVFCNLLNNAAKYTERGGRVALTVERQGGDAVVSVRDTGVGIPAAMLPKVFDLFTQADRSLEKSQGGLGIGLSLVKGLVEKHGGSAEARSEGPGRGSEFVVRLPLVLPPAGRDRDKNDDGPAAAALRRRVLVVDDNRDAATTLAMLLSMMGHQTRTAHDGLEALAAAEAFRADVILLDIGMPKLNGNDVARRLRQEPWGRDVTLVALTGWGQEDDRRRSLEAGFNFHLVKPIDPAELEKLLVGLPAFGEPGA
jgi:signal transduction histidine kinase